MGLGSFFKDALGNAFKGMINEAPRFSERMIHRVKLELWRVEKRVMKSLTSLFILFLSFATLALAAVFFLIESLNFTKALAFLTIGVILLIIGIILKL